MKLFKENPEKLCYRTGLQGVEGEFWYYETHFKGLSFKFVVPEEFAELNNFGKVMELNKIESFVLVKGIDYR
jgi:hypothetical protein